MMFVVLDVNIIISALITQGGIATTILSLWEEDRFEQIISPEMLATLIRKAIGQKLAQRYRFTDRDVLRLLHLALIRGRFVVPPNAARLVVTGDPEDDGVLATAVLGHADYLVTGDRRLQRLGEYQGVKIVTPRTFHDILAGTATE